MADAAPGDLPASRNNGASGPDVTGDGVGDRRNDGGAANEGVADAGLSQQQEQDELPVEYQLYEVDLTNPDMDPLEYTFRRFVPIPRVYFWDSASDANDQNRQLPFRIKMWHRSIYYAGECLKRAEAAGGVIAGFLGLNSGPFDYVVDGMTEEEMRQSQRNVEQRMEERAEMEQRKEGGVV